MLNTQQLQPVTFKEGKRPRKTLEMPTVHFIELDDWVEKLGEKPYLFWKRMYTWIDRKVDKANIKLKRSLQSVAEEAGISLSTLRRWIKVLWEYGLIDLEEWTEANRQTQKPVNIIVYVNPQNDHSLRTEPLEKCRDWKTDYHSAARVAGLRGGRPTTKETADPDGFKNETVETSAPHGFKNKTVDGFKNETVTVSEMKPNNKLNPLYNNLITTSYNNLTNLLTEIEDEWARSGAQNYIEKLTVESVSVINDLVKKYRALGLTDGYIKRAVIDVFSQRVKKSFRGLFETILKSHLDKWERENALAEEQRGKSVTEILDKLQENTPRSSMDSLYWKTIRSVLPDERTYELVQDGYSLKHIHDNVSEYKKEIDEAAEVDVEEQRRRLEEALKQYKKA